MKNEISSKNISLQYHEIHLNNCSMKIGFDAKRAFLNNTGLGNYSRNLIYLLSKHYPSNEYLLYTPKDNKDEKMRFIKEQKNITISQPKTFKDNLLRSYWRSKNIIKDLLNENIDLYHGLSHELPLGIEKTRIKSIVTIHDLIFIKYPKLFNPIDRKIYLRKCQSSCIRANKIIAVSKQTKSDIIKYLGIPEKKIQVVYQGCDPVFHNPIKKEKKEVIIKKYKLPNNFLLSVGTIEYRKNLLTTLKALRNLTNENLVIIGEGKKYKKECLSFIKRYKLDNRTFFLSKLSAVEIAAIYQEAKILIYPSLYEGFGIPILEGIYSKTPVITSKGGCFSEVGGKQSIYIDPRSSHELTDAVIKINTDNKLKKDMIKSGREHSLNFSEEKISKQLMKVYKSII